MKDTICLTTSSCLHLLAMIILIYQIQSVMLVDNIWSSEQHLLSTFMFEKRNLCIQIIRERNIAGKKHESTLDDFPDSVAILSQIFSWWHIDPTKTPSRGHILLICCGQEIPDSKLKAKWDFHDRNIWQSGLLQAN